MQKPHILDLLSIKKSSTKILHAISYAEYFDTFFYIVDLTLKICKLTLFRPNVNKFLIDLRIQNFVAFIEFDISRVCKSLGNAHQIDLSRQQLIEF